MTKPTQLFRRVPAGPRGGRDPYGGGQDPYGGEDPFGGDDGDDDQDYDPRGRRNPFQEETPRPYKGSLMEMFKKAVNKAITDYPKLAGRFLFVNEAEKKTMYDIEPGKTAFQTEGQIAQFAGEIAHVTGKAGSSMATKVQELGVHVLSFTPLPFRLFTTQDQPYEMEAMATFYHELGHLVAPSGFGSPTMALPENVADVYGILRHLQEFGSESKAIELGSWSRAWRFVLTGQGDHFTSLSIDAMPKLLEKLDVNALTPAETASLASRIALQNTPHIDVMATVAKNFQPVLDTFRRTRRFSEGLKALAEITLSEDHANRETYFTFRIGKSALKRFLDGKVGLDVETQKLLFGEQIIKDTSPIKLEGEYWDGVRKRLAAREAQMDKEGVLFGMPHLGEERKPKDDAPPAPTIKRRGMFG